MHPGLLLRQARERLGLTYREVERASYELAVVDTSVRRGRQQRLDHRTRPADVLCGSAVRLPLRVVRPGWYATGDAAPPALALFTGSLAYTRGSRSGRARDRRSYTPE